MVGLASGRDAADALAKERCDSDTGTASVGADTPHFPANSSCFAAASSTSVASVAPKYARFRDIRSLPNAGPIRATRRLFLPRPCSPGRTPCRAWCGRCPAVSTRSPRSVVTTRTRTTGASESITSGSASKLPRLPAISGRACLSVPSTGSNFARCTRCTRWRRAAAWNQCSLQKPVHHPETSTALLDPQRSCAAPSPRRSRFPALRSLSVGIAESRTKGKPRCVSSGVFGVKTLAMTYSRMA